MDPKRPTEIWSYADMQLFHSLVLRGSGCGERDRDRDKDRDRQTEKETETETRTETDRQRRRQRQGQGQKQTERQRVYRKGRKAHEGGVTQGNAPCREREREFFIDNLLVSVHHID